MPVSPTTRKDIISGKDASLCTILLCKYIDPKTKKRKTNISKEIYPSANSWKLSTNEQRKKRTQLDYRKALAQQLIGTFRGSRKRKAPAVTGNYGLAHWPIQFEKPGPRKGCAKQQKRHEVSTGCRQCNIRLCIKNDCFFKWHQDLLRWNICSNSTCFMENECKSCKELRTVK